MCSKNSEMQWLLVGLVGSLKSPHKDTLKKPLLFDLTSPTSNQMLDIDVAVSVNMAHFKIV